MAHWEGLGLSEGVAFCDWGGGCGSFHRYDQVPSLGNRLLNGWEREGIPVPRLAVPDLCDPQRVGIRHVGSDGVAVASGHVA